MGLKIRGIRINTFCTETYKLAYKNERYIIENNESNKVGFAELMDNVLNVRVGIEQPPYEYMESFDADQAFGVELELDNVIEALASELYTPFWCRPVFTKQLSGLPEHIQGVLLHQDTGYTFVLPVCSKMFRCSISGGADDNTLLLNVSKLCGGYTQISGKIAVIVTGAEPYETMEKGFQIAVEQGLFNTKMRLDKEYPPMLEYLGWCTWNAFYHDVSSEKIIQKAEEFQEKKIPVRWIMIDDGWSPIEFKRLAGIEKRIPDKILDLCEDKVKFPDGIRQTIDLLKTKFGIDWVGVWHSITAYWCGIKRESKPFEKYNGRVLKTNSDYVIPAPRASFSFFHEWHEYLKENGVDFLKVDTQGNLVEYLKYMPNACDMTAMIYDGFCRSVSRNFSNRIINCMALSGMCMYNSGETPVTRSSDDFYPDKKDSFRQHAIQNAYNSVFASNLFYCDYDMWWSSHSSTVQSGMLRAVSGGPIYLSDRLSNSKLDAVLPLIEDDGRILRCDKVGLPTEDCLFTDVLSEEKILKIYNCKGDDGVIALFNLSDKTLEATISAGDFKGTGDYVAYVYTQKKFYKKDKITIRLSGGNSEIVNYYHVEKKKVCLGDLSKYASIASRVKTVNPIDEL